MKSHTDGSRPGNQGLACPKDVAPAAGERSRLEFAGRDPLAALVKELARSAARKDRAAWEQNDLRTRGNIP
jgi:hypothetical protein